MMRRGLASLIAAGCLALAQVFWPAPAGADAAGAIQIAAGTYHAAGKTPDGKAYEGDVAIAPLGHVKAVLWRLDSGAAYKGIGLETGTVFGVAYGNDKPFGLVIYKVAGGRLDGRWSLAVENGKGVGREVLQGPAGLNGSYDITTGENPNGTAYTGRVEIRPKGDTYILQWFTPSASAVGIGVLVNGVLAVAYGQEPGFGIVAYQQQGDHLQGLWSGAPGQTGSEDLTPQQAQ